MSEAGYKSSLIQNTGIVTIHFKDGQPVSFPGTVTRWRNSYLHPHETTPNVQAAPPLKVPYINWPDVTAITVKEAGE